MTRVFPRLPRQRRSPTRRAVHGRVLVLLGALGLIAVSGLSGSAPAMAQAVDPMQRFFIFQNDTPVPIYPVISGPKNANCTPGDLSSLRIVVNRGQQDAGIPPGGTVTVTIPKEYPCPTGGFYNASRIYLLLAKVSEFESNINPAQRTVP